MKLKELLSTVNEKMKDIKGAKYNSHEQYQNTIALKLNEIDTELGELLRFNYDEIRLIKREDLNVFGSVGELLFTPIITTKPDKRVKHGYKGIISNIEFIPYHKVTPYHNHNIEKLLDMELKDLQKHFDNFNRLNTIDWYDKEIQKFENKILELKKERDKLKLLK